MPKCMPSNQGLSVATANVSKPRACAHTAIRWYAIIVATTASMLLTPCHLALEAAVRQACRSARPAPWRPQRLHAGTQPPSLRQRCAMLHAPVSQDVGQHVKHRPHVRALYTITARPEASGLHWVDQSKLRSEANLNLQCGDCDLVCLM